MNDTKIAWTERTWNPASGCVKITAGCKHCYAETIAENKRGTPAFPNGFDLTLRPHKLREPLAIKEPSLVFVNSMSDLFWEQIDDPYRDRVLDVIEQTPRHQYQVLTKRPENLLRYSRRRKLPGNFWAGVTIESQDTADRLDLLRQVDAEIRFVSCEPILTPIDFGDLSTIQWMITGGESGTHLAKPEVAAKRALVEKVQGRWIPRPERVDWIRSIRDQCLAAGTAFFHKQWGGVRADAGGRVLDGRTWDEFPRYPSGGAWTRSKVHLNVVAP